MFERLVERLSISKYKENFILKGGLLIASMIGIAERTTMDMDTTIQGLPMTEEEIEKIIKEILALDVEDGIHFEYQGMQPIREDDEYNNFCVSICAMYGKMKIPMKIDITTGDKITPRQIDYGYKFMFEDKSVLVKAYTLETIIAEKYETVIRRNIGNTRARDFYDLFETPTYKEFFKKMKEEILNDMEPRVFDREEGGDGKLAMAPICVLDNLQGFWVLGSYTSEESKILQDIYKMHWTTAELVSDFLLQSYNSIVESAKSRGAGKKLREELARQSIVNNALAKINSRLSEDVEQVIAETLREVALHMDLDRVFLYTFDKENPKSYMLRSYFDVSGEAPGEEVLTLLPERLYLVMDAIKQGDGCCMLDRTNMTQRDVINLMRYNFRAEIAYPIYLEGRLYGLLIFAESKSERIWTKEELRFSQSISLLVQNMLENADGDDNVRNVNKHLIETYNSFHEGIFIRDLYNGYVFFSNKALNDMLGYDLTGGDSRKILVNLRDKFEHMDGIRKDIVGRKISNWCSYVPALDEIMDITEVPIEWLQGGAATMIIMKKAKDN